MVETVCILWVYCVHIATIDGHCKRRKIDYLLYIHILFLLCVIQESSAIACTLIFSSCSSSTMGCRQRWQANEAGCFSASVMFMPDTLSKSLHKIVYFCVCRKTQIKSISCSVRDSQSCHLVASKSMAQLKVCVEKQMTKQLTTNKRRGQNKCIK